MLFNSFDFLLFFPIVTIIYFLLPGRFRWFHLLIASCLFYMAFVPIYIFILFGTIIIDYIAGIMIETAEGRKRKLFLVISLITNIGVLAVFKYYNFFISNINYTFGILDVGHYLPYLKILLPIGLSFHTFQAMSYTIEVYRGNQKAEHHFGIYALYVMFYPQLVAGPIERPQNILHQFHEKHDFDIDKCKDGLKLIIWGLFKKIVIADRLALTVNTVYKHPAQFNGLAMIVATIFFTFQVYCDFSGYTDIARGAARVMGFELMVNFNLPYSAKSVSEFWRRWHISLSTWFNDYLFTPMTISLRNYGLRAIAFASVVTFFISGVWHGAAWHYIVWGGLHGIAIAYEVLTRKARKKLFKKIPVQVGNFISVACTFSYISLSYIFFRASNLRDAMYIVRHLFTGWGRSLSGAGIKEMVTAMGGGNTIFGTFNIAVGMLLILILEAIQYKTRDSSPEKIFAGRRPIIKYGYYYFLVLSILLIGAYNNQEFIYFQF